MCAKNECDNAKLRRLTTTRTFTCSPSVSFVKFHVFCVDLGFHVVIGVGRLTVQQESFIRQLHFTTHTQFQVQSSFLLNVAVRLCPVIVNSNCIPNSCIFHIAKTGLLRCCLYRDSGVVARTALTATPTSASLSFLWTKPPLSRKNSTEKLQRFKNVSVVASL